MRVSFHSADVCSATVVNRQVPGCHVNGVHVAGLLCGAEQQIISCFPHPLICPY